MPKDTRYRIIYVGKNRRVLDTATGQTMSYGTYVRHVKSAPTSITPKLPYLSITMTEEYHNPSMEADVLLLAKEARKLTALELQHEVANMEYADEETGNEGIDASVIPVPQRIQALLPKEKPHGDIFGVPIIQEDAYFLGAARPVISSKEFMISLFILKTFVPEMNYKNALRQIASRYPVNNQKNASYKFIRGEVNGH